MAQRKNLISGTTANRDHAHELIDQLPGCPLSGLIGFLETIVRGKQLDPVAAALPNAPIDDEPLTGEGRRAIAAADEWLRRNDPIPLEDVLADFGLTTADWETMGRTPLPELKKSNGARKRKASCATRHLHGEAKAEPRAIPQPVTANARPFHRVRKRAT